MRTMHPVLKRGGLYWDRELLPPAAYHERFKLLQEKIAASGDDAWLFYGDVERYGAVAWFSNFLPRTRSALALVPRAGDPVLLISVGQRDVPAAKTLTWVDDVRPFSRLPRALAGLIEEKGLQEARLGLVAVEELIPIKDWDEIRQALPGLKTQSRTRDVAAMRANKDPCEMDAARVVAGIVADGLEACARAIAPGKTMREITAVLERHLRANAAEDVRIMAASGEQAGVSLRPADSRVLKSGDCVMIYAAAEAQRYWAEAARTFVVGPASEAQRGLAERAQAALAAMRAALRAGVSMHALAEAAGNALGEGALCASARGYGFGNGIGLDADEFPLMSDCVADNSTLALRIIGHADGTGIAVGETIVLRNGQVERLTGAPDSLTSV